MMIIRISQSILQRINRHGEFDYPYECCGFLLGSDNDGIRHITDLRMQKNERDDSRENRFLISPEAFKDAERYADEMKIDLLGIYHSHPDHPADPSEFDREHAWPWFTYVIVSVNHGKAGALKAWQLKEDRSGYQLLDIRIENENSKQSATK